MKYVKLLPLLILLGCKLEEPKVFEQYNCQLPTAISVTKDPVNGKKFSFAIVQSITDVASLKWTIKNSDGSVINTSNSNAYSLTLANEGRYTVQVELVSKCGENKTLNADFEAYGICNLIKCDYYFKSSDGLYEGLSNATFSYNASNEIIKDETIDKANNSKYTSYYEKNETNLGSTTQPYILEKGDGGVITTKIYCDLQRRIIKDILGAGEETTTYSFNIDVFLEQEVSIRSSMPNIEYRTNYKYPSTGLVKTYTEFDKTKNLAKVTSESVYTYSSQIKSPKYAFNFGFNRGVKLSFYFKNRIDSFYDYSTSTTPKITTSQTNYTNILDKNNQPISEKTIADDYLFEIRNFVFDCK